VPGHDEVRGLRWRQPRGARFCNGCGAPLAAGGPTEVRKTVTVLFCDLVGSTPLGDGADPEVLRGVMARFHAELRAILERHGGTVEKFIGDAAMARFAGGYRSVLGDDALDETVGFHLEQAHRYRVEVGPDDDAARDLAQRAGRALAAAGRRAHARADDGGARGLLGRAAGLLGDEDPRAPSSSRSSAARCSKPATPSRRSSSPAARRRPRSRPASAAGSYGPGWTGSPSAYVWTHPRPRDPLVEAEVAIAELERLDDVEAQARAWRTEIEIGFVTDDMQLVGDASEHLLACARRTGIRRDEVWAVRGFVAALTCGPTPVTEAIPRAKEALARFPLERAGEDHLALLYAFAGRFDDAFEAMDRSRRVREELGQILDNAVLSIDLALIAFLAGRPERAEPTLVAAFDVLEAGGEQDMLSSVMGLLGETCYRLGRDDEALEWARRSEQAAPRGEFWRATRAKVLARRGEASEALRLGAEALGQYRGAESLPFLGSALSDHAEVLLLLGRREEARLTLEEALEVTNAGGSSPRSSGPERSCRSSAEPARHRQPGRAVDGYG
jgi:tetratricopeptide (TPR) repeat protein